MLMLIDLKGTEKGYPNDDKALLIRETAVPDLVPGYPEGPAYDFFLLCLKTETMESLTREDVKALYRHVMRRRDRIFVWSFLREWGLTRNLKRADKA